MAFGFINLINLEKQLDHKMFLTEYKIFFSHSFYTTFYTRNAILYDLDAFEKHLLAKKPFFKHVLKDVSVNTIMPLMISVDFAFHSVKNLLGSLSQKHNSSLKKSLVYAEISLANFGNVIPSFLLFIPKLVCQILHVSFYDPSKNNTYILNRPMQVVIEAYCDVEEESSSNDESQIRVYNIIELARKVHPLFARALAPLIIFMDTAITDPTKHLIHAIAHAIFAIGSSVGACFSIEGCSMRKALAHIQVVGEKISHTCASLIMSPIKFSYHTVAICWNPVKPRPTPVPTCYYIYDELESELSRLFKD
jgi:hypothetical protein